MMLRMLRKSTCGLLALILCLNLLPLSALAVEDVTDVEDAAIADVAEAPTEDAEAPVTDGATYSGTCGENVRWSLNTSTGELIISGTGAMEDYYEDYYDESISRAPWYSYWSYVKTATIQSGVTYIGRFAFSDCKSLTSVMIPDSVTSIGDDAFLFCNALASVTIPDSVTSIGNGAFSQCESLTSVTIPNSVSVIGASAFYGCTSLADLRLGNSITDIGWRAFEGCKSLVAITLPNSIHALAEVTFGSCTGLTSVTIPASPEFLSLDVFENCTSLKDVYYAGSESDWAAIINAGGNDYLFNATIHYNFIIPGTNPFIDVADSNSYYKYVMWAYENGIVKGTSATTFSPNADCTRGQFALMLYRLAGKPDVSGVENPFKDVKKSDSYYKAILWAYNAGIIKGTSATTFNPAGSVTRGQIVLMLYRMAGKPEVTNTTNPFTDVSKADSCYKAVLWAVEQGITKGTSATTFSPNKNCTRYQLVTFLYRFNDLMKYI